MGFLGATGIKTRRGNKFRRCGAQTPNIRLRGRRPDYLLRLPYSSSAQADAGRFAPQRRNLFPRFFSPRLFLLLFLLLSAVPVSAKPAHITTCAQITTYAEMAARLQADAQRSPLVRVASLGKSAGGTRQVWLVRLADPKTSPAQTQRILVLCRQHGDEPASTEALLRLIHGIASGGDPGLRSALSRVTLYVVPMVNPDGAGAGTRVNAHGADLNRDWGRFTQPETRAVAAAAKSIHPALVIDAHNWDGSDEYDADCLEIPREMESVQGRAAHAWQHQEVQDLARSGYAVHPTAWGDSSDPHLAHRWFLRQGIPSALVETHFGSLADRADFERREGMYAALVHSLARRPTSPWIQQASADTDEAALFPPLPAASATRQAAALPRQKDSWLWAFGLYALALWGMSLRKPEEARPKCPAAHYSYPSKRDKTETLLRSRRRSGVRLPPLSGLERRCKTRVCPCPVADRQPERRSTGR